MLWGAISQSIKGVYASISIQKPLIGTARQDRPHNETWHAGEAKSASGTFWTPLRCAERIWWLNGVRESPACLVEFGGELGVGVFHGVSYGCAGIYAHNSLEQEKSILSRTDYEACRINAFISSLLTRCRGRSWGNCRRGNACSSPRGLAGPDSLS